MTTKAEKMKINTISELQLNSILKKEVWNLVSKNKKLIAFNNNLCREIVTLKSYLKKTERKVNYMLKVQKEATDRAEFKGIQEERERILKIINKMGEWRIMGCSDCQDILRGKIEVKGK